MSRDASGRRYRWKTPIAHGRWLPTKREAKLAAVRAKLGSVEDWPDAPVYLHPLVTIEADPPEA